MFLYDKGSWRIDERMGERSWGIPWGPFYALEWNHWLYVLFAIYYIFVFYILVIKYVIYYLEWKICLNANIHLFHLRRSKDIRGIMSSTSSCHPRHHVIHVIMSSTSSCHPRHHVIHVIMSSSIASIRSNCSSFEYLIHDSLEIRPAGF